MARKTKVDAPLTITRWLLSFASFQTWQVYPDWPSTPPDGLALETQDTFDGSGQIAKHINTTREDQSWEDTEYGGIHYWLGQTTTTTYYVHSTALGGKTIAEVQNSGSVDDRFVYSGGARIATYHWAGGYTSIEATNPVTGAAITTDANASQPIRQEPDPLGRDLASPPQPGLVSSPLGLGNLKDQAMPIEATWGPSQDYLDANAAWDTEMRFQTWLYQTDYFKVKNEFINAVVNKDFTLAEQIMDKNPNFIISINGHMTAGKAGGDALESALLNLPGVREALGMNQGPSASAGASGGGGGGGTGALNSGREMAEFDPAKLKDCVRNYGIDPNTVRFTPSQPGQNGEFIGYMSGDSQRNSQIAVVNDLHYNSVQIGHMGLEPPDLGITIMGIGGRPAGRGYAQYSQYRNYTSKDLTNPIVVILIQVHELGHSLAMITGVHPQTDPHSKVSGRKVDDGTFLERCVFGGQVAYNGRLYR